MSDVIVVTGSVDISGAGVRTTSAQLFEQVDRGMSIVQISGFHRKGNSASQSGSQFVGFTLQAGVSGDWVTAIRAGNMTFGDGLITSGELYGMGTGDGGFASTTGLTTNEWLSVVGYGVNADFIFINPLITDTQRQ